MELYHQVLSSISLIGSTSCGKSTIGNLLTGRYILPSGVQETTTCIVEVCHTSEVYPQSILTLTDANNPQSHYLKPKQLRSDAELRTFINQVMTAKNSVNPYIYIQLPMNISPRKWQQWATHHLHRILFRRKPLLAKIGITEGFTVRDFPGFQHEQDSHRLRLMENHLEKEGLIFFIFNAEETDSIKEDKLLSKLFDVLHHQGRDWRSIVFILNRKDAFYRDNHPEAKLQNALQTRQSRIKKLIGKRWKQEPIDSELVIIPLSAGLALATEMLCWRSDFLENTDYHYFLEYIDNYGISLLPDQITNKLSRQIDNWSYKQWLTIYQTIYFTSGFNQLVSALNKLNNKLGHVGLQPYDK